MLALEIGFIFGIMLNIKLAMSVYCVDGLCENVLLL